MKNIALIGVGKMGISHFAIANSTYGLNVVAVSDTSKPLLWSFRKNLGINTYSDYKLLLEKESVDAVIVSVPNVMHYQVVSYCLERNIHVFIEKPLTLTYQDSLKLQKLANNKGLLVQVGYVNRFNLIFTKLKALLDSGLLGRLNYYQCSMRGGVVLKKSSKGWRNNYASGGGCLYDYGPHCIDLAVFFFGEDVKLDSSNLRSIYSENVDDMVEATVSHQSGIKGNICVNWSDESVRKATNVVSIHGEFGKIEANKQEIRIELSRDRNEMGYASGEHNIYVTDLDTNVEYYLRGEDFSRQMQELSDSINEVKQDNLSSIGSAIITDRLIAEIFEQNGVVING